jgi:nucleotide-binding universal stress UspA family protein
MGSVKAIQRAAVLAKEAVAYEVIIIHVMEARDHSTFGQDEQDADREPRARVVLDEMMAVSTSTGIEAKAVLLKGHPVQAVLDYAEDFKPDMILVGSRGMNASRRALIGSVASAISNRAKNPVLVVRSD